MFHVLNLTDNLGDIIKLNSTVNNTGQHAVIKYRIGHNGNELAAGPRHGRPRHHRFFRLTHLLDISPCRAVHILVLIAYSMTFNIRIRQHGEIFPLGQRISQHLDTFFPRASHDDGISGQ